MVQRNVTRPTIDYRTVERITQDVRMTRTYKKTVKRVPAHLNVTFSCPCYE